MPAHCTKRNLLDRLYIIGEKEGMIVMANHEFGILIITVSACIFDVLSAENDLFYHLDI